MYTFSGELPFKESTRLAGVLQMPDMHKLHNEILNFDARELSVSWLKDGCHFHLLAKHRTGIVTWLLFHTKGVTTSLVLQTAESSLQTVYALITAKTNDVVRVERIHKGGRSEPTSPSNSSLDLSSAFHARISDEEWVASLLSTNGPDTDLDDKRCALVARATLQDSLSYMTALATVLNDRVSEDGPTISVTDLGEIEEKLSEFEKRTYKRWRISTLYWTLSARAHSNCIEIFLVRSDDSIGLSAAEVEMRREVMLHCTTSRSGVKWWNGKRPITADEMRLLMKAAFAKLVERSLLDMADSRGTKREVPPLSSDEMEKQLLAQKIITQQEQLQRQIARDLHDAVIADVTVLKRALKEESGVEISKERVIAALDGIATRLREICYDLSPTDLRDWGLQTTLEALIEQASDRTSAKCTFQCNYEIPQFEGSIDLHIFRVLQESINNVIKYAQATEVKLSVDNQDGDLVFAVRDNGKGIDFTQAIKNAREGGMGMSTMQERVGLIRVYYPATLTVRSKPGRGTMTRLAIQIPMKSD